MSSIQIDYSALARALQNEPDFYDRLPEAKETMRREEDARVTLLECVRTTMSLINAGRI